MVTPYTDLTQDLGDPLTEYELVEDLIEPWVPEVFLACGGNFRCWRQPREKPLARSGAFHRPR